MQVSAIARDAGRNVVHSVSAVYGDGSPAPVYRGVRRSAHRYNYAIAHWAMVDGRKAVIVDRWSRSPKVSGAKFAVAVVDA